ncbi:MAG: MerR family transcriptional regulator [Flavobacteriales bacterium]
MKYQIKEQEDMKMQEFTIKDLENFSGIKAHTIRIWEQRYGLLAPDRTDTNIRKYTDKDLKFLLNVSLLNNLGYKISQIATMSEDQMREAISRHAAAQQPEQHFLHMLKISMLNYDEELFNEVIEQYINENGMERTFKEVIIPFMKQIGILWQANVICPAQEHFISSMVRQKIFSQIDNLPLIPKTNYVPHVLYLPELEIHELSLIMMHYLLKLRGYRSIFLGQSVPFEDLLQVYQRLGEVKFVSIFTTNPSTVLVPDYLKKITQIFAETGCEFHITGNNLQGIKSPDPSIIHIYSNSEELSRHL